MTPVANGDVGELYVRGPSAAEGYWNQREKSRATFQGEWTRTGDKYTRDEAGRYDRVASIEMFEAVGEEYWPVFFNKVREVLRPGGTAGLQIITINDDAFPLYRKRPDFIQRYVFPGGMLPSPSELMRQGKAAGLSYLRERIFPQDYACTLAEWRQRFHGAWDRIAPLGFDTRFRRLWEFYLYYCEAGFRSEYIDVRQVVYRA